MDIEELINSLREGQNYIVYGPNNAGKTTLLTKINETYVNKNAEAIFNGSGDLFPCVYIPAKRVFEFSETEGINSNKDKLTIDVVKRFGKEWIDASSILSIREKIRQTEWSSLISQKCKSIFDLAELDTFGVKCSDGVQNVVNILSYISHVLSLHFPEAKIGQLLNTKFLLIIDEIELFLYTKSLSIFIKEISSMFKEATMVFSSHSILVMQRLKDFRVLKITDLDSVEDVGPSPYFQDLGSLLEPYYGVKEYPPELEGFAREMEEVIRSRKVEKPIEDEMYIKADKLRDRYPALCELITDLQLHFAKRLRRLKGI